MTGINKSMNDYKRKQLIKLTEQDLPTKVIAERLGLHTSQVNYYQKILGIWKGERRNRHGNT